jgi:hypothetical protein
MNQNFSKQGCSVTLTVSYVLWAPWSGADIQAHAPGQSLLYQRKGAHAPWS